MLDSETKRRIDTCRDILVGKVPDPKSQVEQITIALIYKFMDDMDAEAEELGGERQFFTGEFARYGWSKLMAPGLGGHEMLSLYAEAIQRMNENPGIPTLFRDIFKNAFLPYRDPETLRSFLKEIDSFTYDHSERLGDAFEYLLSVLGSQGDAGQFRTPRHIIDFMVEIIDPKKEETILDPACGTAGFLISAYKHILKHNSKEYREQQDHEAYDEQGVPVESLTLENPLRYSGDLLTPDDRKRLAENIRGYDISPDMVRLSLVNLYLHGFTDPHIEEYDTLTSDEKWNELADVILANPPFMSPKGGIKPHKRFSVQSKRSEVLFVDYIAEHLTPNGRAAVVVPEGIIFQSQNAYRQLREMLVKGYLVAVISLPAGVFNPYSGVKTSILVMDKRLAKQRDDVLFVKIENDGFNLGAQRRPIDRNDLPEAVRMVKAFLQQGKVAEHRNVLAVSRERIGEGGEWNLSSERYQEGDQLQTAYPIVEISEVIGTITPPVKIQKTAFLEKGRYPILDQSQDEIAGWTDDDTALIYPSKPLVIFGDHTCAVKLIDVPFAQGADGIKILETIDSLLPEYLFWYLKTNPLESDGYKRHFSKLKLYKIPLPPLEVQKEIVAEIDGYQKIIDGARQVVENYQPRIPIDPDWPMVELGDVCNIVRGSSPRPKGDPKYYGGPIPRLMVADITRDGMYATPQIDSLTEEGAKKSRPMDKGSVIITVSGNPGLPTILATDACIHDGFVGLRELDEKVVPEYLYYSLLANHAAHGAQSVGAVFKNLTTHQIREFKVALPSKDVQQEIVEDIQGEQHLVDANKELIQRFEEKIKQTINRVWGEVE